MSGLVIENLHNDINLGSYFLKEFNASLQYSKLLQPKLKFNNLELIPHVSLTKIKTLSNLSEKGESNRERLKRDLVHQCNTSVKISAFSEFINPPGLGCL